VIKAKTWEKENERAFFFGSAQLQRRREAVFQAVGARDHIAGRKGFACAFQEVWVYEISGRRH
jgi:hypothetical protein